MPAAVSHKRAAAIAPFLDSLCARMHRPDYLGSDPLCIVHRIAEPAEQEAAALLAALLAYGNVRQINASLTKLFDAMDWRPGSFIRSFDYRRAHARLSGFKHRFTEAEDVLCLLHLLQQAYKRSGSLEGFFLLGYEPEEQDLVSAAGRFIDNLFALEFAPEFSRALMLSKSSFKHLLPRADKGSACKRIHLFLRWMVRPRDGIDLGLWSGIPPSKLLIPVDTHILRLSNNLGIVKSKAGNLKTARAITSFLRLVAPDDPVGYDFALCRLGILKECPTRSDLSKCAPCELNPICDKRRRMARREC